jgi:FAD/FMN-containing dehydrogenase
MQCNEILAIFPRSAWRGDSPPLEFNDFFSARQKDVIPACIVQPATPSEGSQILQTVTKYDCNFAVKSGGHAMFEGASNAICGVTIDMRKFKDITVSQDRKL